MRALRAGKFEDVSLALFEKLLPWLKGGLARPEALPDQFRHQRWGKAKDKAVEAVFPWPLIAVFIQVSSRNFYLNSVKIAPSYNGHRHSACAYLLLRERYEQRKPTAMV